jgi:hypothetical protein
MIHGNPFVGYFPVKIAVANGRLLELLPQAFGAPRGGVVQHRLIDKAAALTRLREPVESTDRRLRQHDIDTFCHSGLIKLIMCTHDTHTQCVCQWIQSFKEHDRCTSSDP